MRRWRADRLGAWALHAVVGAVLVFLLAPIVVPVIASFSAAEYLTFPPRGFSLRWYGRVLEEPEFRDSLRLSLVLGLCTTAVALGLGTAAAFALARYRVPGQALLQGFLLSPLVFPTLVTGIALLQFFTALRSGQVFLHLVVGHAVITIPYVVRTVTASLQMVDRQVEDAARTLGAGPVQTFWRVTLPLIRPGLAAGGVFAFVTSFDNFTVSMWLKDAEHVPMPLTIFSFITRFLDPTVAALSTLLIVGSLVLIVAVERVMGLQKVMTL